MRVHALFHSRLEPLGAIAQWVRRHEFTLTSSHSWMGETIPDPSEFDILIILGGPQTPKDKAQFPFLQHEIDIIKAACAQNKIVLGICLGAQLLCEAFEMNTQASPSKEFGYFPVTLTEAGRADPLFADFPETFSVMHWHNDMPELPEGAVLLAGSQGCPNQAIRFADRVYGLQFHMEFTHPILQVLLRSCHNDLIPGPYTQSPDEMIATDLDEMHNLLFTFLDRLVGLKS